MNEVLQAENLRSVSFLQKCLSSRRNLLVYWLLPCDPHFPTLTVTTNWVGIDGWLEEAHPMFVSS